MKKVMVSVALMLSAVMLTADMSAVECVCATGVPTRVFREDCCKYFDACIFCEKDVSCAGECDGSVILKVCRTNAYANVRVSVDKKSPIVCDGTQILCVPRPPCRIPGELEDADSVDATDVNLTTNGTPNSAVFCKIDDLCCGKHTLFIEQDCPRCCKLIKFEIESPDKLKVNCCSTVCSNSTGATGSATVKVTGGTPPYTFEVDGGSRTPQGQAPFFTFDDLSCKPRQDHDVKVTDSRCCTAETTIKIECCKEEKCFEKKSSKHDRDHRSHKQDRDCREDNRRRDCRDDQRTKDCRCRKCECRTCECSQKVAKTKKGALVAAAHARKHKKNR